MRSTNLSRVVPLLVKNTSENRGVSPPLRLAAGMLLASGIFVASCASDSALVSIRDRDLGLSKTSVFEAPAPDAVEENQTDPGELPLIPPAYAGTPPRVPHNVVDLLPIRRDENWCLDCHLVDTKEEGEPTPIPASHFVDFRTGSKEPREEIVGARYVCVTCHVAPTGAEPLIENLFVPVAPPTAGPIETD